MGATSAPGNHDVDPVWGANHGYHLFVIVCIDEPWPKMSAISVALRRSSVFQLTNRLSGVLEKELPYVLFAPTVLMKEPGMFRANDHKGVAHDVHLDIP